MQNPRSVEDQLEYCSAYAAREGLSVVATFADRARSGGRCSEEMACPS
ncbi:recombinase family protein [Mesorhizobium australicum]